MKKTLLSVCAAALATTAMATTTLTLNPPMRHDLKAHDAFPGPAIAAPAGIVKQNPLTRADGETLTMDFQWGYDVYTAQSFGDSGVGVTFWQAIEIPAEMATQYAGATVTSINFYNGINNQTGQNSIRTAEVYICSELGAQPKVIQQQTASVSQTAWDFNQIVLDEPYTIKEGEAFYVAYSVKPVTANDYFITIDGYPSENPYSTFVGYDLGQGMQWYDSVELAMSVGALSMGITIEGDNLPVNGVEIFQAAAPSTTLQGDEFPVILYVAPDSATPVNSIEVEIAVPGSEPEPIVLNLNGYAGYHTIFGGTIGGNVCTQPGDNEITVTVTKVNGEPNTSVNNTYTTTILCMAPDSGYPRAYVLEEGTGTWCGYCPAGMVFMDWMKETYPEVIRVAIHAGNGSSTEPMQVESADDLLYLFSGFPMLLLNRSLTFTPTTAETYPKAQQDVADYIEQMNAIPAYVEVSDLTYSDWTEFSVMASAKVRFALDRDNTGGRYGLSFSVCEDGMGPYMQTNYYARNAICAMGGWERKPAQVATWYNDVLREASGGLYGWNAFPEEIKAGEEYEFKIALNLSDLKANGFYLNAIVTDNYYGEIVAAKQIVAGDPNAVEEIAADGQAVETTWLDVNGMRLDEPQGICIKRTVLSDGTVRYDKTVVKK